jgi:hypothetical protein
MACRRLIEEQRFTHGDSGWPLSHCGDHLLKRELDSRKLAEHAGTHRHRPLQEEGGTRDSTGLFCVRSAKISLFILL